ncbi:beta-ketoacyl synthase N-terminal-like domain-containing protein [Streptomyces sp. BBFR2]|uniref:beta-ketoacyl [acyl carrier protein] synthase domain-containing protein n=1 Tax=Streptomyces sp. BBFR2 TaxID=3372854 RepID=UPI0037D9D97A
MTRDTDIAVIGAGCRFPDAGGPEEFWRNIEGGLVSVRDIPETELYAAGLTSEQFTAADFVPRAARVRGAADFAAGFFGYSRDEAETIDPQQRLFLEVCWEALESAGHPPRTPAPRTGVFAGSHAGPYSARLLAAKADRDGWPAALGDLHHHLGGVGDFTAARVSYKLGLRGPATGVQAACASALYAVHHAVRALLAGDCEMALAGGATVLEPVIGYRRRPDGSLSADGLTRSYDAASTGTAYSSGVGAVVLRRLPDALADGDPVLAVIRGTAVGNHGDQRPGFTAPSAAGVAAVVGDALRAAAVTADRLGYVEGHGIATPIGDRIEIRGLTAGLGGDPAPEPGRIALGSVKANIGHAGAASGIAALLNAVNVVRTGAVPPHPLFSSPREPKSFARSPFTVTTSGRRTGGAPFVLVNAMGFGGMNAAAVLAPPPAPVRPPAATPALVRLPLSARTREELDALALRLADAVESHAAPVGDLAYTLRVGRTAFAERRVVTAPAEDLAAALRTPEGPAVRTARVTMPREAALVVPPGRPVAPEVRARLRAAFKGRLTVVPGDAEVPAGAIPVRLPEAADAGDLIDDAVHTAWLHGVAVDWPALSPDRGRRVALPTYPFRRERYWALGPVPALAD